ncbi:MAG: glycosyltransferase family 39 protein [Pseudomonadota bacterium]
MPFADTLFNNPAYQTFKRRHVFFTALLCVAWMLPGLVGHDPWKPDEAYSFGLVYHILQSGDWVVPTLAGEPFMEKPPLFYLTAALCAKLLSPLLPLHDGARFANMIYMAFTFLFVGLAGRELHGRGYGWVSVLVLLGCLGLLVRTHQLITDVALLAGFGIALYGLALAARRPLLAGLWLGTGAGVGFMAKGLIAPGVLGIIALALPLFPAWRKREYIATLSAALLAALPWLIVWPVALYLRSPELFTEWLWTNNFGRFLGFAQLGPAAEPGFYFSILPWYGWPALPLALWTLWREGRKGLALPALQLPLLAFAAILFVLSIASDAREVYALPMLPPLALLAAGGIGTLRRGAANALYWFGVMGFTFFAGVAWLYWVAMDLGVPEHLAQHLNDLQPGYTPALRIGAVALAAFYTAAWIITVLRVKRSAHRPIVIWAAGITTLWGLVMILMVGWLDTGKSYRSMIASLQQALPKKYDCISSMHLGEPQRALLQYFAGIVTYRLDEPQRARQCQLLITHGAVGGEFLPPGKWQKIWEGARPGDDSERDRLYVRER